MLRPASEKRLSKIREHYFSFEEIKALSGFSRPQFDYFMYKLKLIKPLIILNKRFFTYNHLLELRIIREFKERGIKYIDIRRIKDELEKKVNNNDLHNKWLVYDYTELYLVEKDTREEKLMLLQLTNPKQTSVFETIQLDKVLQEIEEKAKSNNIKNFERKSILNKKLEIA